MNDGIERQVLRSYRTTSNLSARRRPQQRRRSGRAVRSEGLILGAHPRAVGVTHRLNVVRTLRERAGSAGFLLLKRSSGSPARLRTGARRRQPRETSGRPAVQHRSRNQARLRVWTHGQPLPVAAVRRVTHDQSLDETVCDPPAKRDALDDDRAAEDGGAREHALRFLAACNQFCVLYHAPVF